MKILKIILLLAVLMAAMMLESYPVVYDGESHQSGTDLVYSYYAHDLPAGAIVRLHRSGEKVEILSHKEYVRKISGTEKDSLIVAETDIAGDEYFLELEIDSRLYVEMIHVPAGKYAVRDELNRISQFSVSDFLIGKYEISNRQFQAFMGDDGYEMEDYWQVEDGMMKDPTVGWYYQGLRQITKPLNWDMGNDPWYKDALYPGVYDPVSGVTWFEVNAYCNWCGVFLPTYDQLLACFDLELCTDSARQDKVSMVKQIQDGAAEWTSTHIPADGPSCGRCNEMQLLENCQDVKEPFPASRYKCPLFRFENLGFRIALPYEN